MSEQPEQREQSGDAQDTLREMREHERQAEERASEERRPDERRETDTDSDLQIG